jgi:hypothetical protein
MIRINAYLASAKLAKSLYKTVTFFKTILKITYTIYQN